MNSNMQLVERWLTSFQNLEHGAMAACYHDKASFSDIAFRLRGRKQIHAMWHMICEKGIQVAVDSVVEEGDSVRARIVDTYTFSDTGRPVVNKVGQVTFL